MRRVDETGAALVQINQKHPADLLWKIRKISHAEYKTMSAKVRELMYLEINRYETENRVTL